MRLALRRYPAITRDDNTETVDYIAKAVNTILSSERLIGELHRLTIQSLLGSAAATPAVVQGANRAAAATAKHGEGDDDSFYRVGRGGDEDGTEDDMDLDVRPGAGPAADEQPEIPPAWVLDVAKSRTGLAEWQTLHRSLLAHLRERVRRPICHALHDLEKWCALSTFVTLHTEPVGPARALLEAWFDLFGQFVKAREVVRRPLGVESLQMPGDYTRIVKLPFSKVVVSGLQTHHARFAQTVEKLRREDVANPADFKNAFEVFRAAMTRLTPASTEVWLVQALDRYTHDFMALTGLGMDLPPESRSTALLGLVKASRPTWFEPDDRCVVVDLHLLLWLSEEAIRAQLGLLAIIARVGGARVFEGCVPPTGLDGHVSEIGSGELVDVACRTVLGLLAEGDDDSNVDGRGDIGTWVVGARQVYTQMSALLNSSVEDDDEDDEDDDDEHDGDDDDTDR
jgi:hypothetical protein